MNGLYLSNNSCNDLKVGSINYEFMLSYQKWKGINLNERGGGGVEK